MGQFGVQQLIKIKTYLGSLTDLLNLQKNLTFLPKTPAPILMIIFFMVSILNPKKNKKTNPMI
jgi:hypothetical protein